MKWTYLLAITTILFSCNPSIEDNSSPLEPSEADRITKPEPNNVPELSIMTTSVDNLRLRETPGSDGKELMRLPEKSVVMPTGNKTDLKQVVSLRGLSYNEPWIEVKVDENITGWLYAGAVDLDPNSSQFTSTLFENRIKRFFGTSKEEVTIYYTLFENAKTAEELQTVFDKGKSISAAASKAFQKRCRMKDLPMDIELRWIKDAYPGFIPTKVAEGTEILFLPDLNQMLEKAELTTSKDDDLAFNYLKSVNGGYSLLLSFRDWYEQTTDYGGVSLLGSNKHFQYLSEAQKLFDANNIFSEGFISEECNQMVADIVSNEVGYKRGKDSVLAEINKIKNAHFSFLTEEQNLAIENRIKQFEDPKANKIYLNERVGQH